MSSAALAGADPAPPPPPPAAPIVISGGAGCNNCAPAPACGSGGRTGLLDRLKSRFGGFGKKSRGGDCGCPPPPSCAPPCPPTPQACNPCPTSCADRPNLLDKMKSRWGKKKSAG